MIVEPNCRRRRCIHYSGIKWLRDGDESSEVPYCRAFPDGIPPEVSYGDNPHTDPIDGDGGIVFKGIDSNG